MPHEDEIAFYVEALNRAKAAAVPFLVGGAYALREYADIYRETKDLDLFCRAGDYPALLHAFQDAGCCIEVTDANWLAKAFRGDFYVDLIFNSHNGLCPVDDSWFRGNYETEIFGVSVALIPPEEEIWAKVYVQDRHRYDGADIYHIIRKMGSQLDWDHLLRRLEVHWQLLLAHLINFQFVYPSEASAIPNEVIRHLLDRQREQGELPPSRDKVCRGWMLSTTQYDPDLREWGYVPR